MKTTIYAISRKILISIPRFRRKAIPQDILRHEHTNEPPFPTKDELKLYDEILWASFKELPEPCRRLLLLRWENYRPEYISLITKLPEEYIRKRSSQYSKQLIKAIKNHKKFDLLSHEAYTIDLDIKDK